MKPSLTTKNLHYTPDAALNYAECLAKTPWTMLLNSAHLQHIYSRFDILVSDPSVTITTKNRLTTINYLYQSAKQSITTTLDPLKAVQQELARYEAIKTNEFIDDLPFIGGAVGVWSYDFGRYLLDLPTNKVADNLPEMSIGIYEWALIADHKKKRLTLISYTDIEKRLHWLDKQINLKKKSTDFKLMSNWQSNLTRAQYKQKFEQIQKYLYLGDCYQVNLAQRFCATYQGDPWKAFISFNQSHLAPFSAFIQLPQHTILSFSPERFLSLKNNCIQTRPIKGTLPRLNDIRADLQQAEKLRNSKKDRAENIMIVDLLRNDIGRIATPGSVAVPELCVIEAFSTVYHLVSTVTGHLPDTSCATELLRACFPGGSITGAPKLRAMEIIDELEPSCRSIYCGSIGYISFCGTMDTNIAIRTLLLNQGNIYCWAGGAILVESDEASEYQETLAKVSKLVQII